ncbi:MAG: MMPL family transporter [Chloroflexi bacterium]|nr:MAG: MMPL family transporter [Chloroflexota bacterium]
MKAGNNSRPLAGRAGRWSATHWRLAVAGWAVFAIVAIVIGIAVGTQKMRDVDYGTGQSAAAQRMLDRADFQAPADESVLVQSPTLTVSDTAFQAGVGDVMDALSRQHDVTGLRSPLDAANGGQVSRDHHSALVQFQIRGKRNDAADKVAPILSAVAAVQTTHPQLTVAQFGFASATHELNSTVAKDFQRAEVTSVPITLVILLIAFGALLAAGVPVLLAISSVLATTGLAALVSHLVPAPDATNSVILLIGMAVGVDYSLFYIRREREERAKGLSHREALFKSAATSGQAVLISGLTVLIAMSGMLLTGSAVFTSIALGSMLMVAVALIGSLTVLPAVLSKLGDRVNKGRIPFLGHRLGQTPTPRMWSFIVDRVLRRPALFAVLAGGALVALAIPALSLHTQLLSFTDLPKDIAIIRTYDHIQQAFPGSQTPAEVIVQASDVTALDVQRGISALEDAALASGQMTPPIGVRTSSDRTVASVSIPLQGNGANDASKQALDTLRSRVIPQTIGAVSGTTVAVTGETAGTADFNDTIKSHAPLVFGFVILLAFVLLLVSFRSIVIPIKAVLLNLLSVAAAYGVLVLIFQHSWAEGILNFHSNGAIASWLPLFLFVILFGLSMDYHVFILSRVKELVDGGMRTSEAVAQGIKGTASVVTSAAIVMVAVFAIFATLHSLDIKQMGIGLAVAIFIDATVIRAVLLPATMKLLGEWNWYLPRWLEWLPRVGYEPAPVSPAALPLPQGLAEREPVPVA